MRVERGPWERKEVLRIGSREKREKGCNKTHDMKGEKRLRVGRS